MEIISLKKNRPGAASGTLSRRMTSPRGRRGGACVVLAGVVPVGAAAVVAAGAPAAAAVAATPAEEPWTRAASKRGAIVRQESGRRGGR